MNKWSLANVAVWGKNVDTDGVGVMEANGVLAVTHVVPMSQR